MKNHVRGHVLLAAAVLGGVALFALGSFAVLEARSVVAEPGSASPADPAPPNPGHSYDQVELPVGTWTGLDADLLDGQQPGPGGGLSAGTLSRSGFSTTTVDSNAGESSIVVGADGLPFIAYRGVRVTHCGNAACTAGNVSATVDSGILPSVTVGADGLPLISYCDSTNWDLKVAHCGNVACTTGNTLTTVDSAGQVGQYSSVTIGADGLPIISYYDLTNRDLKVAHCGNAACSAGNTLTTVDSAGAVGLTTSVAVGVDGLPLVSYYDETNMDLKVAHCGDAACTAGNTLTAVDSVGNVGFSPSVTVGVDGLPVIGYMDFNAIDLKVTHCGDLACTAGNTSTIVDSAGNIGFYPSVTIGADGLPLVSYGVGIALDLKVGHCGNPSCTAFNALRVDTTDAVGEYSSVTIGADGLPLVSYYDQTSGDLKVMHCSNRFCVPYHRPR